MEPNSSDLGTPSPSIFLNISDPYALWQRQTCLVTLHIYWECDFFFIWTNVLFLVADCARWICTLGTKWWFWDMGKIYLALPAKSLFSLKGAVSRVLWLWIFLLWNTTELLIWVDALVWIGFLPRNSWENPSKLTKKCETKLISISLGGAKN